MRLTCTMCVYRVQSRLVHAGQGGILATNMCITDDVLVKCDTAVFVACSRERQHLRPRLVY